jgi:hypothetical protein
MGQPLNEISLLNKYGSFFFKEENLSITIFRDSLKIIDLSNAQKTGKTCKQVTLYNNGFDYERSIGMDIEDAVQHIATHDFLIDSLQDPELITTLTDSVKVRVEELKGVRVFSPFIQMKPIKEPKKWTIKHVIKAIYSNQLKHGQCKGRYTDDYAYDNSVNYRQGLIDQLEFIKNIIESPSGWRAWSEEREGKIIVNVNCYSFNCNEFVFVA